MSIEFLLYVAAGFAAQLIDGTLGMAYGVTATTLLLTLGLPPGVASATVHAAECMTTGVFSKPGMTDGFVSQSIDRRS